jgi:hypothetical protein
LIWFGLVWFGLVWFNLVWFGLVWFGLIWFGLVWFGFVLINRDIWNVEFFFEVYVTTTVRWQQRLFTLFSSLSQPLNLSVFAECHC